MINAPRTLDEAKKLRYGARESEAVRGWPYYLELCAWAVRDGWSEHQCPRAHAYGPEGLYCKQHAKRLPNPPLAIEYDPPVELTEYDYGAPADLGDQ